MEERIQEELERLKDIILNTVPVEELYLFGSYAYGEPNADSDLDLYVVVSDDIDMREIDAAKLIYKAIRDKKTMPTDIIVSKKSRFDERKIGPTIERKVVQEGILLWGRNDRCPL